MKTQRTRLYLNDDELCSAIVAIEGVIDDYNRRCDTFGHSGSELEERFEKAMTSLISKLDAEFILRDLVRKI